MAWRPCRVGVFVLADHAVAVRHQRDVPVVPGADVLHHRAVHGVVACHGGRAGCRRPAMLIAQVLPAEFRSDGRCGVDCGADRGHSRQGRPDAVRLIRFASSLFTMRPTLRGRPFCPSAFRLLPRSGYSSSILPTMGGAAGKASRLRRSRQHARCRQRTGMVQWSMIRFWRAT